MFLLDSLMIDGISWVLRTVTTAAEAEMNDDTALREQLLAAEMQRELGEISDEEFAEIERDLLSRIRDIKQRRDVYGLGFRVARQSSLKVPEYRGALNVRFGTPQ